MYEGVGQLKDLIVKLNETQQSALLERLFSLARDESADIDLAAPVVKIVWILLAVSTLVVTTRLVIKFRSTRRLYLDDGLMTIALVSRTIYLVFSSYVDRIFRSLLGFMLSFYKSHSTMASAVMSST
jgi:hypothetical protein